VIRVVRIVLERGDDVLREIGRAHVILRIADVGGLARGAAVLVLDDAEQSVPTPSSMNVNDRLCLPPVDQLQRFFGIALEMNCVKRRELPSFGSITSSSCGPIQLNRRKSV